jgi:hypothetical protein
MEFNTLDEIIKHFNIEFTEGDDVKKELKNLIKKIHPDKNDGEFKSETDKTKYNEIIEALGFLELNNVTSIATKNDVAALTKVLNEIVLSKKADISEEKIERKVSTLSNFIQESIKNFHNHNSTPKITSIVIATLITALWAFPNVVKDHPLLGFLYHYNKEFTIIWLFSLIYMGILWLQIKMIEQKDEEIKCSYKLESTQNNIFSLFTTWMYGVFKNFEIREDKRRFITFTKEDLINFLITRYAFYNRKLKGMNNLTIYEIGKVIKETEDSETFKYQLKRKNISHSLFFNLLPRPGEIDLEIANLISDLIIERLFERNVIVKVNKRSLSDIYEFELEN